MQAAWRTCVTVRAIVATLCAVAALLLSGVPSADAKPRTKRCGSMLLGTAHFSQIRATSVSCRKAKGLLDKATVATNRQGAMFWYFGGWSWSVQALDEMTSRLRGKRGQRRIRALWAAT